RPHIRAGAPRRDPGDGPGAFGVGVGDRARGAGRLPRVDRGQRTVLLRLRPRVRRPGRGRLAGAGAGTEPREGPNAVLIFPPLSLAGLGDEAYARSNSHPPDLWGGFANGPKKPFDGGSRPRRT